ncbi:MAG: aminoacyl-histidine dipeptidase [Bacteroidia bacterium]|nr:aminoacyl-histidine dipeptidase [Bacteroidia bacterium]MCZ2249775.1 aminoacyl-histidine dipeptidase [Bacteroidia bacterium]
MKMSLNNLQPQLIWNNFEKLNAIPRASKKETQVVKFIENFGKTLGLETYVDKVGNVIIKKPATAGMENKQTIALQSHLDMVHQKNSDTDFDFDTEGIKMYIDGDWVKARGTTLGADNGIGVATIMSILESKDIPHPPLEALFTIDEETGMTGALSLQPGLLKASIMLNLDTEEDNELTIGCAGGIDVTAQGTYKNEKPQANNVCFELVVKGLTGGHSGTDIHLGRGNANKIMNRILGYIANQIPIQISTINGGGLRNAIPRESKTKVCCQTNDKAKFEQLFNEIAAIVKVENAVTDPDMAVQIIACDVAEGAMNITDSVNFIRAVSACPNGIFRMSSTISNLVQSSNNLAAIELSNGKYSIKCLTRSSVDTEKLEVAHAVRSSFELIGANVAYSGSYPGWTPKPESDIVKIMSSLYVKMFNDQPLVNACHAGLECGILNGPYPNIDMISFGPTIRGAHSPDEKVSISSVQKFWKYLLETLKNISNK